MVYGYRDLIRSIRAYWRLISVAEFKICRGKCSLCGFGLIVQFSATEMGIRCARCRASAVHMSLGFNIARLNLNFASMRAFEMSSRGPFVNFLKKRAGALELSEYWPDIPLGAEKEGISCQNVEQLTFRDSSFHLCTSTEVFEHVSDDTRGFSEIHRVLKPGGWLVFSVPLKDGSTLTRAEIIDGELVHHVTPPEYHNDLLGGPKTVLAYRTYGTDIVEKLENVGFRIAGINDCAVDYLGGHGRKIVVAQK